MALGKRLVVAILGCQNGAAIEVDYEFDYELVSKPRQLTEILRQGNVAVGTDFLQGPPRELLTAHICNPTVENASVENVPGRHNVVTVACDEGYRIAGLFDPVTQVEFDCTSGENAPLCVKDLCRASGFANAKCRTYHESEPYPGGRAAGTQCTVKCNPGFLINLDFIATQSAVTAGCTNTLNRALPEVACICRSFGKPACRPEEGSPEFCQPYCWNFDPYAVGDSIQRWNVGPLHNCTDAGKPNFDCRDHPIHANFTTGVPYQLR